MTSTRQTILEFLNKKQIATSAEIGLALRMTSANVRHHLSILRIEGAVAVVGERPTRGRGRPAKLFALTSQTNLHNLDSLSNALLAELLDQLSGDERTNTLRQIALRLAQFDETSASLTQRLYQAIHRLNEMQYRARWEAHAKAPYLILGHCPYALILPEHPELCTLDALLIEELLGRSVVQTEKLLQDDQGTIYCRFMIHGQIGK